MYVSYSDFTTFREKLNHFFSEFSLVFKENSKLRYCFKQYVTLKKRLKLSMNFIFKKHVFVLRVFTFRSRVNELKYFIFSALTPVRCGCRFVVFVISPTANQWTHRQNLVNVQRQNRTYSTAFL